MDTEYLNLCVLHSATVGTVSALVAGVTGYLLYSATVFAQDEKNAEDSRDSAVACGFFLFFLFLFALAVSGTSAYEVVKVYVAPQTVLSERKTK